MRLLSLKMINVRSHNETFVEFQDGITVIWGKTGSGKSTILMAIDYALFGSAELSSAEIMARNAKKMLIELKFLQNNEEYTIVRGLKRAGDLISIDTDNLFVLKNSSQLNVLSRANDINSIIKEILGFSQDSKPSLMFQVLSYTKQDNVRNLIEMKKEERQEFIDKILQLSKYKTAYENLKPVIDNYSLKYEKIKQIIEFLDNENKGIALAEKNLFGLTEKMDDNNKKLIVIEPSLLAKTFELKKVSDELKILRQNNEKFIIQEQRKKHLQEMAEKLEKEKKSLEENKKALTPKLIEENFGIDEINKKLGEKTSIIKANNYKISSIKKDNEAILGLMGVCPTCRQSISDVHKKDLSQKNNDELLLLEKSNMDLKKGIGELDALLKTSKKNEELKKELSALDSAIIMIGNQIKNYESEIKELLAVKIESFAEKIDLFEENFKQMSLKINDLSAKKAGIESSNAEIKRQVNLLSEELDEKKAKIEEYGEKAKEKNHVRLSLEFLAKLRANVKDIRQIIRARFLNDFKNGFAKKFEEIRNDGEYYVEINADYEPVAYSAEGIETPINHLSGGEKTSAALAYRLALSDLAGEMNNLMPAELLILDEPTSGFDNDDIKALPDALNNLSSIPQIIIVTHETLLKEIANNCVEVRKDKGQSKIIY